MFGKSAEEKLADQLAAQQRGQTEAAEQAQRAYASSPVGRAEAALKRGDRFFQIHLPVSSLSGDRSWFGSTDNTIDSVRSVRFRELLDQSIDPAEDRPVSYFDQRISGAALSAHPSEAAFIRR